MDILNKILNGNCENKLKEIPSESVDVCFADPPFNLKKLYLGYEDKLAHQAYLFWSKQWILELIRVTKPTGSIFIHNIPLWLTHYSQILNDSQAKFKHWISWDAATSPMGKSLQPAHYGILYYAMDTKPKFREIRSPHKRCRQCLTTAKDYGGKIGQIHPFGPLISDVWADIFRVKHEKYRNDHPCQLPIHLLERIILMSTDEGDVILDPFMGTGTSAIAAKRMGRNYIGIEQSEEYIKLAEERLGKETEITKIGDCPVSFFLNYPVTIRDQDWEQLQKHFFIPEDKKALRSHKIEMGAIPTKKKEEKLAGKKNLF